MTGLLNVEHLSKSFGGLAAVKDVNFHVDNGKIVSIIGPNGAGKTTVFNLLTGIYKPDSGKIVLDDRDITGLKTTEMVKIGICRTFQNIRLFAQMSVIQNVLVGYQSKIHYSMVDAILNTPRRRRADRDAIRVAEEALEKCGFSTATSGRMPSPTVSSASWRSLAQSSASRRCCFLMNRPRA